jgi:hypothetical protein
MSMKLEIRILKQTLDCTPSGVNSAHMRSWDTCQVGPESHIILTSVVVILFNLVASQVTISITIF